MVKQTIQIFARVKPSVRKYPQGIYSIDEDEKLTSSLEIILPRDLADGFVNNKRESYRFKFQQIFDQDANQEIIFENIAKPVAESVLAGYNGTIFAYGQTGSGKTFTITGGAERYSDRGIIPRTLSYIFEQLQKDSSKIYTTHISYLEIYNECGYDLLDPRHEASGLEDLTKVTIFEDTNQNIHLKNLSLQQATTEEEALNLLFLGDTNRMIAETPMNQASTRSHCIFTIHLSSKEPGCATVRHAKLHLVDLAGSERVSKTGVGGLLLTEAKYINLSLHYLEQVIIALSEKHRSHIPYRNSMMTSVLRDSLGGNCMTTMIATLSLEKRNIGESISTCRFAQRVALIKNEAVLNEEIDPRLLITRLQREVQDLKDELALVTREPRTEPLTEGELLQLEKQTATFLEDQDPESRLEVGSDMRKIHHCFHHFKKLLNDKTIQGKSTVSSETKEQDHQEPIKEDEYKKLQDLLQQRDNEINILVNMLKKEKKKNQGTLHSSGAERSDLRLSQNSPFPPRNPQGLKTLSSSAPTPHPGLSPLGNTSSLLQGKTGVKEEMSLGRQEAFEIFKRDHADSITIEDNKQILKQRFSEAKALGESINKARSKVGSLKEEIVQRHMQQVALGISENTTVPPAPDPVEEKLRAQLEKEKKSYKADFVRLKALKVEIEHLQLLMDRTKVKLQKEFEDWWAEETTRLQVNPPATNSFSHMRSCPQTPEFQSRGSRPLSHGSSGDREASGQGRPRYVSCEDPPGAQTAAFSLSTSARRPQPSPGPILQSPEHSRLHDPLTGSLPERPPSSIPLTGDSQTDSDILAFIRARQNILQRKCLGSN
ncbi:kinesin-like protein KIF6 [Sorex araneus]|uniref:kinesin-like protein KIF6 n=1 Tax=Sorex araneus TaxID=42254 RepID=UPI0024338CA4|nr:kinesin-like protein KIF6 [Sorex araneus]